MKSLLIAPILVLLLCLPADAHTLYLTLSDYDEDTVEVEGMFSNGTPAAGVKVIVYEQETDRVIWQGRADEFGACIFERPEVPYAVELDAGPGHQARQDGI